jgi:pimeloyl-ACP methyl ester carboxylesterase
LQTGQKENNDMISGKDNTKLPAVIVGAAAGALAASFLLPGYTPPVPKKRRSAQSIASLEKCHIGRSEQWILIRSEDVVNNPILLILHGGPGTSELTLQRRHTQDLESSFTVVNWDQRGAGKSFRAGQDESKMTIDQLIEDTRELAELLVQRFGKKKIILQGRSWGSALGMLTVSRYPGLFYTYVGIGQISDMKRSETLSYQWTLSQAHQKDDKKAIRELVEMGPPPYTGDWQKKFNKQRKYVAEYGGEKYGNSLGGNATIVRSIIFSEEYTMTDKLAYNHAAQRSLRLLHPQLIEVDLFAVAPSVDVPVFFAEGRHDRVVPSQLSAEYFNAVQAPLKELTWFEQSAHMPDIEERERYHKLLIEKIRPLALGETVEERMQIAGI